MNNCNYYEIDMNQPYKESTIKGSVDVNKTSFNADNEMPPSQKNGGLYSGEQSNKPWASIPVTPTATNYINNNLKSANPPPGATKQYVGTNRFGNNYVPTPGVKWYNDSFFIKGL